MSLVQAVLTKNFILVASDTRALKPDDTIIENHNKIIKLNKEIIFGCTGGTLDNYNLFYGFCDYSEKNGFSKLNKEIKISYNDFVKSISDKFTKLKSIHDDINNTTKYTILSIICGYNGFDFEATLFSLTQNPEISNGIFVVKRYHDFPYKCITAGKIQHRDEFEKIANIYHDLKLYDFTTIRQYKNILTEVFDTGSKTDKEINNNIKFERIRLKDVISK